MNQKKQENDMAIISDNKIRVTGKAKPGQRVIRISNGFDIVYMPIGIAGTGGGRWTQ